MEDDLFSQLDALGAEPVASAPVDRAAAEKAFVEESGPVGAAISNLLRSMVASTCALMRAASDLPIC
jgi:hypothetical protein